VVDDSTPLRPGLSYGAHKLVDEVFSIEEMVEGLARKFGDDRYALVSYSPHEALELASAALRAVIDTLIPKGKRQTGQAWRTAGCTITFNMPF
jgi:hypothetical protein